VLGQLTFLGAESGKPLFDQAAQPRPLLGAMGSDIFLDGLALALGQIEL
jgi:hypothetical protein